MTTIALDHLLTEMAGASDIPGVAVAMCHDGYHGAASYGITNVTAPLPVTSETVFQTGSLTKIATLLAAFRLLSDGRLALSAPVGPLIPSLVFADPSARSITVRQLLTHASGLAGDLPEDTGADEDALACYAGQIAQSHLLAPPGSLFAYSNLGYSLLGRIIELLTGEPYERAIARLVTNPLRLSRAHFASADMLTDRFSAGHDYFDQKVGVNAPLMLPRGMWPAAGLVTTATDVLRLVSPFMCESEIRAAGIDPALISVAQQPSFDATGGQRLADWVGLTWMLTSFAGTTVLSHTGGTAGQRSIVICIPSARFAVCAVANARFAGRMVEDIALSVTDRALGLRPDPSPAATETPRFEPALGEYESSLSSLCLRRDGGRLTMDVTAKAWPSDLTSRPSPILDSTVEYCGSDTLRVASGPLAGHRARIFSGPDGAVNLLRFEGRLAERVT
jgi:CubicO group peptidase (beta-lactamase class C family)